MLFGAGEVCARIGEFGLELGRKCAQRSHGRARMNTDDRGWVIRLVMTESRKQTDGGRVRLQRVMADAGVAARRVCERLIEEGRVRVNGEVVRRLPVFVDPENDVIEVNGQRVRGAQRRVYLMLNKPEGVLVSGADEPGLDRPTILNLVNHPAAPRLFPVGRLDLDTTGLVLLTNDGELANRLTHPRYGVTKTYHAVVRGGLADADIAAIGQKLRALTQRAAMEAGVAPRSVGAPEIAIVKREDGRTLLEISLREGGLGGAAPVGARGARGRERGGSKPVERGAADTWDAREEALARGHRGAQAQGAGGGGLAGADARGADDAPQGGTGLGPAVRGPWQGPRRWPKGAKPRAAACR
jgi:23S rRNA pseudouridine2605 synthase